MRFRLALVGQGSVRNKYKVALYRPNGIGDGGASRLSPTSAVVR